MKFSRRLCCLLVFTGVLTPNVQAQEELPVFLEPDSNLTPIATLDPTQIDMIDTLPVLDANLAAQGWMFTEYFGTFVGFVDPETVTKSLGLTANTPVYLRPDRNSPVLALIQENDPVEIIRVGTDWTEVEFKKLVPVYFQIPQETDTLPQTEDPSMTGPAVLPPVTDAPIPVDPLSRTTESAELEELDPIETPPVITPGGLEEDEASPTIVPRGAPAVDIPRMIQGKLRPANRVFGFAPKYRYELQSGTKKRIAWVDLSEVMVHSLSDYEFKQVIVYGEIVELSSGPPLVKAKTIRLQF